MSRELAAAVRVRAFHARPYFATALLAMQLIPRPGLGTMRTDKWGRVYIDTDIIGPGRKWSVPQAAGVLIHELGHWLRKHFERDEHLVDAQPDPASKLREATFINICEDMEINDDLVADCARRERVGIELPEGAIVPATYGQPDGELWEVYYANLKKNPHPGLEAQLDLEVVIIDCGSVAHGVPGDYELPPPGQGSAVGIREAEGDLIRRQVARELQEYATKNRGSVPGGWQRWAAAVLAPPQVAWERELASMVRRAFTAAQGMIDYSWHKPSRRGNFAGCIMPRLMRPIPEVTVVVDTSASMSKADLTAACIEVDGICKALGQRSVQVVSCDAEVHNVQTVTSSMQIELAGGNGTDMRVGIEYARGLGAGVVVLMTDGYTPWPSEPATGIELVVCLIGSGAEGLIESAPQWAKRVLAIDRVDAEE